MLATLLVLVAAVPKELAGPQVNGEKLFQNLPLVKCLDPASCAERARLAHNRGRTYAKQGASVAGNWYRATLELYRAAELQKLAGQPVPGLEHVQEELAQASQTAESIYNDLVFRLARDLKSGDRERVRETIEALVTVVPDESHPIRKRLEEYLQTLPPPAGKKEDKK
jgi:hypothetical protein